MLCANSVSLVLLYFVFPELGLANSSPQNSFRSTKLSNNCTEVDVEPSDTIEGLPCNSNQFCKDALINYDEELSNKPPVAQPPYCTGPSVNLSCGTCTCGPGNCVSRTTASMSNEIYYYCGGCGRIGSQCSNPNVSCVEELSECGSSQYCECPEKGVFYDLYYCYIAYYGYDLAIQIAVGVCIIIALCLLLASMYTLIRPRVSRRRINLDLFRRNEGVRTSPPNDTPPQYDEVVDKLPSYQDALRLEQEFAEPENGIDNPALDLQEEPPRYQIINNSISKIRKENGSIRLRENGNSNNDRLETSRSTLRSYEATEGTSSISSQDYIALFSGSKTNNQPIINPIIQEMSNLENCSEL